MKKFLIILTMVLCFALATNAVAQDSTVVEKTKTAYAGFKWNDGPYVTVGTGQKLLNVPLGAVWSFQSTDFGAIQSANLDFAYVVDGELISTFIPEQLPVIGGLLKGFFQDAYIGVFPGVGTDWQNTSETDDVQTLAYSFYSAGGFVNYSFNENFGFTGFLKRKMPFNPDNGYFANSMFGGYFNVMF